MFAAVVGVAGGIEEVLVGVTRGEVPRGGERRFKVDEKVAAFPTRAVVVCRFKSMAGQRHVSDLSTAHVLSGRPSDALGIILEEYKTGEEEI